MVRTGLLRAGYSGLGLAFASMAASVYIPALLVPGLALALLSGVILAFTNDELPKWAGIVLISYFVLTVLVFLAGTPITIDKGDGYFVNAAPTAIAQEAFSWLALAAPLMLAAAAIMATWERELPPRVLLFGAIGGFLLVALLTIILVPTELSVDEAERQAGMVKVLFALSAAAGAGGALWSAGRADEYA